jgi:class 3 adenylate cyclase
MRQQEQTLELEYTPPPAGDVAAKYLVAWPGSPREQRFVFYDRIELGRKVEGESPTPGVLVVPDATISRQHCIVTQAHKGRCYVRDVSRNGTRVDGRRLVPNVETELHDGQTIRAGREIELMLASEAAESVTDLSTCSDRTISVHGATVATVLVGDIRDYTLLVRTSPSTDLQRSVGRTFELLTKEVERHGGTIKEYQGDAIFAYWEDAIDRERVVRACRAALDLDALARRIAKDPDVWNVAGSSLKMDWALATGQVVIDSFGGRTPAGLSMIGEAVVRAFRIEKLASDTTGSILVCPLTQRFAASHFKFRDLGKVKAKGFDEPEPVFALIEQI